MLVHVHRNTYVVYMQEHKQACTHPCTQHRHHTMHMIEISHWAISSFKISAGNEHYLNQSVEEWDKSEMPLQLSQNCSTRSPVDTLRGLLRPSVLNDNTLTSQFATSKLS